MEKSVGTPEQGKFLEILLYFRQKAGLTQQELAERIEETQSFVSKIERGDIRMDLIQLNSYCQALGITLSRFVKEFEKRIRPKN